MNIEEEKEFIKSKLQFITARSNSKGGQKVGIVRGDVTLISDEMDIEIKVGWFKSQIENRDYALMLFDLALNDLIK